MSPSSAAVAAAACLGVGLMTAVLYWRRQAHQRRRRAHRITRDPDNTTFSLLEIESYLARAFAVTTLTFFRGDSDTAEAWVRQRTLEMMSANPWLTGRLLSAADDSRDKKSPALLRVCHRKEVSTPADIDQYLHVLEDPSLDPSMSYTDMTRSCHPERLVKRGVDCLDQPDEKLFQILFIRISADSYALVVSMSHMLGDGCTYYKLYSMLSQQQPVIAMTVARRADYQKAAMQMVRTPELATHPLYILRMLSFALLPSFNPPRAFIAELDTDWVAEQKKKHQGKNKCAQENTPVKSSAPSFVSTNDVLVSWFINVLRLDFCIMAFNVRQRIPIREIRKSLSYVSAEDSPRGQAGFRSQSDQAPSVPEKLRLHCGMSTNWATFYQDLVFPSSKEAPSRVVHHTPLIELKTGRFPNMLLIFRQRQDQLAMLLVTQCPELQRSVMAGKAGPVLAGHVKEATD